MNGYGGMAHEAMGEVLKAHTEQLCIAGLTFAELNGAAAFICARANEKTAERSVSILLCGSIPDDLVQAMGQYVQGLAQDLKNEGKLKLVAEL